ncbi:1-deoxy-D-xylulose-5-phosphate reductoisomerase [Candidatus Peregrinibacteria bacterium]|nr:1-deoxy-D-xylulose-5-phosphate reductoisomerase [Candidatus Peregrinibacteria bacterium]
MKKIVVLGSTGSIGTQTLDVVRSHPGEFKVIGISAHSNGDLFEKQRREFAPKKAVIKEVGENKEDFNERVCELAVLEEADIIVNAIAGRAGLQPTLAVCRAGKILALANKESLVMAGESVMNSARKNGAKILPIDSEPSAIWQMLEGERPESIEKIILTASGGPFWSRSREQLEKVTKEQALNHPTWKMGPKVTVDSATLMNKAFEIIETRWLFDVPPEKIDVVIHRQSAVHSFVQFTDGNLKAVCAAPDMRVPISYALFYDEKKKTRVLNKLPRLDLSKMNMTFEKPEHSVLEGPKLAYEALKRGGDAEGKLCIADEIAVEKFLKGEILFLGIYDFIKEYIK